MFLDEISIHFGYISKQVSSGIVWVFSDASGLASESREFICYLGELHVSLLRQLFYHDHRSPSDAGTEFPILSHLFVNKLRIHTEYAAELKGVERLHFAWCDHKVISHLVTHKNPSVSVIDDSSIRIDRSIYQ